MIRRLFALLPLLAISSALVAGEPAMLGVAGVHARGVAIPARMQTPPPKPLPVFRATANGTGDWNSGTYSYDGAGNIYAIGTNYYVYDGASRLVEGTPAYESGVNSSNHQTFGYDTYGNITSLVMYANGIGTPETDIAADPATNRLVDAHYDVSGNVTQLGSNSYTWDGLNVLTSKTAGSTEQYLYDADDERVATVTSAGTTYTPRGPDQKVLREVTRTSGGAWTWKRDYVYRDDLLLAEVMPKTEGTPSPSVTRHFHLDHLGTPRIVTNEDGARTATMVFWPFGEPVRSTSALTITPACDIGDGRNPFRYTGHEWDDDAAGYGLNYMHARYELGRKGRFLSVDPEMDAEKIVHEPQRWNRYAYVGNNPIKYIDQNGRERELPYCVRHRCSAAELRERSKAGNEVWYTGATVGAMLVGPELAVAAFTACLGNAVACIQAVQGALTPGPGGEMPNPEAIIPGPVNSQWGKLDYLLGEVKSGAGAVASAGKGGFFKGVMGFTKETLGAALKEHLAANFGNAVKNDKGLYEMTGNMTGANGIVATVKTVWEKAGENTYKFVTAVPQ